VLLAAGADPNVIKHTRKSEADTAETAGAATTALLLAAGGGHGAVAELLLAAGADAAFTSPGESTGVYLLCGVGGKSLRRATELQAALE